MCNNSWGIGIHNRSAIYLIIIQRIIKMQHKFNFKNRVLPIMLIITITIIASILAYKDITDRESDKCWRMLEDSAGTVNNEINIIFENNINILHMISKEIESRDTLQSHEDVIADMDVFSNNSLFSRFDIFYDDDTILLQSGMIKNTSSITTFAKEAAKGEHISERTDDIITGKEVLYYYVPVEKNGETVALVVGVIDCNSLSEIFKPEIYNGQVMLCIADSKDGKFVMDNWHDGLGDVADITDIAERRLAKGFKSVDVTEEIMSNKTGVLSYTSDEDGENSYMYYTPMGIFDWELLVIVREDVAFSGLVHIREILSIIGLIEIALIGLYFWWNLRTVRMLVDSRQKMAEELEKSSTLIKCVTELSLKEDINAAIDNLLEIVNDYFNGDRTYIFQIDYAAQSVRNTFEYASEGVSKEIDNLKNVPLHVVDKWLDKFKENGSFYISNVDDGKDEASYEILKAQNIDSLLAVPLLRDDEIIGFVGVDNPRKNYKDSSLLTSIQFFIMNSITTKYQQDNLEYLSYRDMLTNLYNRNKYIDVVETHTGVKTDMVGVVYMDLNGLKKVNDLYGHEAGDKFIKSAAYVIDSMFPGKTYRIGGDEFVVISCGIQQEEFNICVDSLVSAMQDKNISISCGAKWVYSCMYLEDLLKEADQIMYNDKKKYYENAKLKTNRN